MEKIVETLAKRAGEAKESHEALHLSQAALNVAHALGQIRDLPKEKK